MHRPTLQELLDALANFDPEPDQPKSGTDPVAGEIDRLRRRIDAIDRLVLELLNQRATAANLIGHVKKLLGLPVYVPGREVEVLRNVREANPGPLPDQAVTHLFERIIDETRSLERQRYQDDVEESTGDDPRT